MSNFCYSSDRINICGCWKDAEESSDDKSYPPFTGQEYLDTQDTIDDHPYATAFSQFLANEIDFNKETGCSSLLRVKSSPLPSC